MVSCDDINPVVYALVSNKYATLKELRDDYDIYEVLDMYEILSVKLYNNYVIADNAKHSRKEN